MAATSTIKNPSHTYNSLGLFSVTLTITLPGGCSNTITKYQYIKISPTTVRISNAPNGGCIPFTFQPIATIQSVDSVISYSWNLGAPGAIYSTQSPTHTYTTAGNYNHSTYNYNPKWMCRNSKYSQWCVDGNSSFSQF